MSCCLYYLLFILLWCKVAVQYATEAVVFVLDSNCNFKFLVLQIKIKK